MLPRHRPALALTAAGLARATPPDTRDLERATLRKVARRLLPFLFVVYLGCFLDRVNVGFAALQMNRDLGLSASVFGFGAGILFLGYALCEVPSNVILARVGARRWIARIMVTWGLLSTATMFVHGPRSFYLLRFLLGMAEAGFFPGVIFYLGTWFPAAQRARAISWFMAAIPISGVIGGPLSGALLSLNGRMGLAGWQWLFLLEGVPSVLLGAVVWWYLTDTPAQAHWLAPDERAWLAATLASERSERARSQHLRPLDLRHALTDGTVWQLSLLYAFGSAGVYGLVIWLPQILKGLASSSDLVVGIISAGPYLLAALGMVLVAMHSDRTGERCLHVAVCSAVGALGFILSAYLRSPVLAFAALALAALGILARNGPFWALPSLFLDDEAAAGGIALINTLGAVTGFAAPYAVGLLKDATGGFRAGLLLLAASLLASAALALQLRGARVLLAPAAVTTLAVVPAPAGP